MSRTDPQTGEITPISQVYEWERCFLAKNESMTTWTERVLVTKSLALQKGLTTRRIKSRDWLVAELEKLGRPAKRGQKRYRSQQDLVAHTDQLIAKYHYSGIVIPTLEQDLSAKNGDRLMCKSRF